MQPIVAVWLGDALAAYGFGGGHPFGSDRLGAFWSGMVELGIDRRVEVRPPVSATRVDLELFHTPEHLDRVQHLSESGRGLLDGGDTPAFEGMYEAAATVAGTVLDAVAWMLAAPKRRAFVPVAGLHHGHRESASGFCVVNDCGIAIEALRRRHGIARIAYVDIDAHHGDGVYDGFADDPEVFIADIHEDGRYLFPGTGGAHQVGVGAGLGTKLNLPLPPGAGDDEFLAAWVEAEAHVEDARPEVILLQCGADGLGGDPLTHLRYSQRVYRHAARRLCALTDRFCEGRLLVLGGGGYSRANLTAAWGAVVAELLE